MKTKKIILATAIALTTASAAQAYPIKYGIGIKSEMGNHVLMNCRVTFDPYFSGKDTYSSNYGRSSIDSYLNILYYGAEPIADQLGDQLSGHSDYARDNQSMFDIKFSHATSSFRLFSDQTPFYGDNYANSTLYTHGEVAFSAQSAQYLGPVSGGNIECDVYNLESKHPVGVIGVQYDDGANSPELYRFAYPGTNGADLDKNLSEINKIDLKLDITNYNRYPKFFAKLTASDVDATGLNQVQEHNPPAQLSDDNLAILGSTTSGNIKNATDDIALKCYGYHPVHGSWKKDPSSEHLYGPGENIGFSMSSHGHGVQSDIKCDMIYQGTNTTVGQFWVHINNDGLIYSIFPYINGFDQKLNDDGFKYKIHVEQSGNNFTLLD